MNKRLDQLDSIRGLASLTVVFHHLVLAYPVLPAIFSYSPARIIVSGPQAVILFFILSGFVLSLPFLNGRQSPYPAYIVKRFFRIYVPYLAAICLAILAASLWHDQPERLMGGFFYSFWQSGFDISLIVRHIVMLTDFDTYAYNTVIWSLIQEMRISLVFPFILFFILKRGLLFNLAVITIIIFISAFNDIYRIDSSTGYHTSYVEGLYFSTFFMIGALAAKHRYRLIKIYWALRKEYKWALFITAILVYTYSKIGSKLIPAAFSHVFDEYAVAAAVIVFITMALSSRKMIGILNRKAISYLGKISYSLYLYHFIVLLSFAYALRHVLPDWSLAVLTLAASLAAAALGYAFIEKPAMRWGRALSDKIVSRMKKAPVTPEPSIREAK